MANRKHIRVSDKKPLTPALLAAFAQGGWTLIGGWGLDEEKYGINALNLTFEQKAESE